ncbi:MAG: replicative DNA helicase [Christensenellaceae bacterium]|nr:replicative DNA helicase [Christensenellaceae bacterium]
MDNVQGKTLPHSLQAEQCVLACLMLDYVGCSDGFEKLAKEDFYSPVHQTIYEAMQKLLDDKKGKTIDLVTVVEALSAVKKLDSVGGVAYINTINDAVPSIANFRHYFDIVKKNSLLRKLNTAAKQILDSSWASDDEQVTLSDAEKVIFDISKADEHKELTKLSSELPGVMDRLDTIRRDPSAIYGIKTGFYGIDNLTNGLHKGELVILAARPGIGKTSLGLNMILNAAIYAGKKCAVFSLEMSKTSLVQRACCSLAMVSSYKAGRGELDANEWQRLLQANNVLDGVNIYIDDNSEITPTEIKRKCMRLKREHGLDFIMVDYLGLMSNSATRRNDNRQVEVAANSRAMKVLAKELDIPVLLLAQLNRNVETRTRKGDDARPALHDLRESGAIEQDADLVMFIHMNKPSEQETDEPTEAVAPADPTEAQIILAKHRNGPCGTVKLAWKKEYTTFENLRDAQDAQNARENVSKKPSKK